MLSAYCLLDSAPEGDSVTVVRPFQATPSTYSPVAMSIWYRTPRSTPVSYRRSPTLSQVRTVMLKGSLSEEQIEDVVIQIVGCEILIERGKRQLFDLVCEVAVGISIDDRDLIPLGL